MHSSAQPQDLRGHDKSRELNATKPKSIVWFCAGAQSEGSAQSFLPLNIFASPWKITTRCLLLFLIIQMEVTRSDINYSHAWVSPAAPCGLSSHPCCGSAAAFVCGSGTGSRSWRGSGFSLERDAPGKMPFLLVITFSVAAEHPP